ncbi:MAG: maleylpyruvate isomerase N-terminal domain-containing protein, partial [Jiangellaceae bacterium]
MRRSVAPVVVAWAIATGGAVIAGVRPDQLAAPTRCPEMDVRAMLSHLAAATGQQPRWDDTVV